MTRSNALLAAEIATADTNTAPGAPSIIKTIAGTLATVDQVVVSG